MDPFSSIFHYKSQSKADSYSFIQKIHEFSFRSIFDFVEKELRNLQYIKLEFKTTNNEKMEAPLFFFSFHVLCYRDQGIHISRTD